MNLEISRSSPPLTPSAARPLSARTPNLLLGSRARVYIRVIRLLSDAVLLQQGLLR